MVGRTHVGTVLGLRRYPVKSMLGEHLASLELDGRGVAGDRLYAVRDGAGKFGSGKTTRRFRRMVGLFALRAAYRGAVPVVALPDGSQSSCDDPALAARLSELLGLPVTIAREAEVSHLDAGAVHLLTTASLRAIGEVLPGGPPDERRFRPNVVVDTTGEGFEEDEWAGRELLLGDGVRLRVTRGAERCVMVGFAQEELGADPLMLRRVAEANGACLGVYCDVLVPGAVHLGDPVMLV